MTTTIKGKNIKITEIDQNTSSDRSNGLPYNVLDGTPTISGFYPSTFTIHPKPANVTVLHNVRTFTIQFKNQINEIHDKIEKFLKNQKIRISDFALPCFIFLTTFNSTHGIAAAVSNVDDVASYIQSIMPNLSQEIMNQINGTKIPVKMTTYSYFLKSIDGLSDASVLKLAAMISYYVREDYSQTQIFVKCSTLISTSYNAAISFNNFLKDLLADQPQDDSEEEDDESEKKISYTRKELLKKTISTALVDDYSKEPPRKINLPSYKPISREGRQKVGCSYVINPTDLPKGLKESLLFNTCYVSVFSGSEGGNIDSTSELDQLIRDQEEYFKETQYYPDAQVRINRIEKSLSFLRSKEMCHNFPGFLILAIKDIYGSSAWDIFQALSVNWSDTSLVLIDRMSQVINNYYSLDINWRNFHSYENGVMGGQMMLKVPEPNLALPMTIAFSKEGQDWNELQLMLAATCKYIKLDTDTSAELERAALRFFSVIENVAESDEKIRCYMPRLFISAIQIIPEIIDAIHRFDQTLNSMLGGEYCFAALAQLKIAECTAKYRQSLTGEDNNIMTKDVSRVMKLVVQHFMQRQSWKSGQKKPDSSIISAFFGSIEGVTLIKRVKIFTSIMSMLMLRGEFDPLIDVFNQFKAGEVSEKLYKKRVRDICPSCGLFAISNHGKGIIRVRSAMEGAPTLTVVPVLIRPPPTFNARKR